MANVFYAVIALKKKEVPNVVAKLKAQNLNDLAQWLQTSQDQMYGNLNENWKPFHGKTIAEMIKESPGFRSGTDVIDTLDDLLSNVYRLRQSPITIYFIDAFALFLEKYETLAKTIDYAVSQEALCCLLINDDMPQPIKKQLQQRYCAQWKLVCWAYEEQGKAHRVALGPGDLKNFLKTSSSLAPAYDEPSAAANRDLAKRQDWPTGPFPALSRV
ncbi:MAG: hypothetical protein ACJ74G_09810 [Blastocatellia bacterium]